MWEQHLDGGAGVTVAGIPVPRREASAFGVIHTADDGRKIEAFLEKPADPPGPARPPGRDVRVDGQLRVQHRGAARRAAHRRRGREQQARHGRQHRPDADRAERRAGLRLPVQRGPRRDRGWRALLARRRDDRLVLRGAHGPLPRRPGLQPLQLPVADPHPHPLAPAGEVRARRRRPGGQGDRQHRVERRDRLGGRGARVGALARACTCTAGRRSSGRC